MKKLLIDGATGYTGRMAAVRAKEAGLDLVIAERDEAKLANLASELKAEHRVFALDDANVIREALAGISVLLN